MSNPSSYFLGSSFVQRPAPAALPSNVAPTFGGITLLAQNLDGTLQASWSAASVVPNPPVRYEVYIQQGSSLGLFNSVNLQAVTPKLTLKIAQDANGDVLELNKTYFVGVRAIDAYLNRETNTVSLSQLITFANFNTVAERVWDVLIASHSTVGTFGYNLNTSVDTRLASNDVRLNNLDATISSRASQSQVTSIQNNTNFVGIVPSPMILPQTGSTQFPVYVRLFNNVGSPADPDLNEMFVEVKNAAGSTVVASTLMTRSALGQYVYNFNLASSDPEQTLYFFFNYVENGIAFNQVRSAEVAEFESKLDTLLSRLTSTRASNLDNLDVAVSSRAATSDVRFNNLTNLDTTVSSRAAQTTVDTINTKLGTPVAASLSADIANVQTVVDAVPTAGENADAVWDEDVNAHATGTTTARTLKDAKIFSQIDL